jgi:hypothetical protein
MIPVDAVAGMPDGELRKRPSVLLPLRAWQCRAYQGTVYGSLLHVHRSRLVAVQFLGRRSGGDLGRSLLGPEVVGEGDNGLGFGGSRSGQDRKRVGFG